MMAAVSRSARRAVVVLLLVGLGAIASRPVAAACQRPVSAFAVLAELRDGHPPADRNHSDRPPATGGLINGILVVKESDYLAFPLHAAAGTAFESAGCAPDAVRDQWRKAAMHAFAPFAAEVAAGGLRRTAAPGADLPRQVDQDAGEMPWFADNLARVRGALGSS